MAVAAMSAVTTFLVQLCDPDGYVRVIEVEAESSAEAQAAVARCGEAHWYEAIVGAREAA